MDNVANLLVRERVVIQFAHLHHTVEVHVEQLEHHVECVLMSDYLLATDNIRVLEPNHGLYFGVAHCRFPRCKASLESF